MSTACLRPNCGQIVPPHSRICVVCGADAGFPNVRQAEAESETQALGERFRSAVEAANASGTTAEMVQLQKVATSTVAVWCVSPSKLARLVESDSALHASFASELAAGTRLPEDNIYDPARGSVESAVLPLYHEHIQYAVLSATGLGASGYGVVAVTLRELAIGERSSTFEGPLFPFLKEIGHVTGTPVPVGHRASWRDRALLVIAKLGARLRPGLNDGELADLLLDGSEDRLADCIEVHIYGPIHRLAIAKVRVTGRLSRYDRTLMGGARAKLRALGIELEIAE